MKQDFASRMPHKEWVLKPLAKLYIATQSTWLLLQLCALKRTSTSLRHKPILLYLLFALCFSMLVLSIQILYLEVIPFRTFMLFLNLLAYFQKMSNPPFSWSILWGCFKHKLLDYKTILLLSSQPGERRQCIPLWNIYIDIPNHTVYEWRSVH